MRILRITRIPSLSVNRLSRVAVALFLVWVSVFSTACFINQNADEKQRRVMYARDVVNAFRAGVPIIKSLNPSLGAIVEKSVPVADQLVTAIETSNAVNAADLLRQLLPVLNSIYLQFKNNPAVLGIFALADIALHFLVNHIGGVKTLQRARARGMQVDAIIEFAKQPVWGCEYRPDLCPAK